MSQQPALTRQPAAPVRRQGFFFTGFAVVSLLIVFAGFGETFFLRALTDHPPLPPLVIFHGVVFSAWLVLLLAQTSLVAAGRTGSHRRLGALGGWLAALMLVVGWFTAIAGARRGFIAGGTAGVTDPLAGLALSLRDLFAFTALVAAGIYYRRRPEIHKRLLVLATINILPAAVGRLPIDSSLFGPLLTSLVLSAIAWDLFTTRKVHPINLWGGPLTIASMLAMFPLGRTELWNRLAAWIVH